MCPPLYLGILSAQRQKPLRFVSYGFCRLNSYKIANSNTVIEVIFGDLFEQSGIRAIAVNEFFDSKIGKPVSDKSLHGIFLQKCFGGHPEPFDKQVDEQLKNVQSKSR